MVNKGLLLTPQSENPPKSILVCFSSRQKERVDQEMGIFSVYPKAKNTYSYEMVDGPQLHPYGILTPESAKQAEQTCYYLLAS